MVLIVTSAIVADSHKGSLHRSSSLRIAATRDSVNQADPNPTSPLFPPPSITATLIPAPAQAHHPHPYQAGPQEGHHLRHPLLYDLLPRPYYYHCFPLLIPPSHQANQASHCHLLSSSTSSSLQEYLRGYQLSHRLHHPRLHVYQC